MSSSSSAASAAEIYQAESLAERFSFLSKSQDERERERLHEDLRNCADDADPAASFGVPIEEFGAALLRGMGWKDGAPIGRNAKGIASPIEFIRRPKNLGLGATPDFRLTNEKDHQLIVSCSIYFFSSLFF